MEQNEKQAIEEMAKDICHLTVSCEECTVLARKTGQSKEQYCKAMQYAKRAVGKGYRRQSEGKWGFKGTAYGCSLCGYGVIAPIYNYCPHCGAHMKGANDERAD